MELKSNFSDYTEQEFLVFMKGVLDVNANGSDEELDKLLDHFEKVTEHPEGTDLIYYVPDAECTPETITQKVKVWRAQNGKPGFKGA
ncbi:bacteriocin immunity protein [Pseudomonas sp. TUM22785]|uniref:bacteriocin immunity protein n=1 Tax=Pseudomonas sp. TUM22785 TaxID=3019098 RepID=UPI002305FCE2|nr:bacteriocin immunity protein [Pseudomonas sp. TUM22785]WCD77856.1 bacteriocin immunity protein [Pseudomonas sp. TUM22785]